MGAQIQSKRYPTGYCSIWGLHKNAKNDIWSLYHEDKPQTNGQYFDSLLPWHLELDGSVEYNKEKVRQTILKHESTFRHQLQELHRLYGRQRELMNVVRRSNVKPILIEEEASSSSLFPSHISSQEAKRGWHGSHVPSLQLVFGQSSVTEFSGKESFPGFRKEKNMMAFPSRDDRSSKIWEPTSSKGTLSQRRIIDLEIPADASVNNEAKYSEEICFEVPKVESNSSTCTKEILHGSGVKTLFGNALNDHNNGDASGSSSLLKIKNELADLNEPILLEEMSVSGSAGNPANLNNIWGNITSEDKSATPNSVLNPMWNDTSLSSKKDMNGGACFKSLQSMNETSRKEQLICDLNAKQMRQDSVSMSREVYSRESSVAFQSSKDEHKKLNVISTSEQGRTGHQAKRKLFGVDIFEVNNESLVTENDVVHCANKFDGFGSKQSFLHVKSSVDSGVRSFPSSIDQVSSQNGISFSSQLNAKHPLGNAVGNCKFINTTKAVEFRPKESTPVDLVKSVERLDCLQRKSTEVSKIATKPSKAFQADFAAECNILPADCQSKQKLFKESPIYLMENVHSAEEARASKNYYHLNLDSLQHCSQQFFKNSSSLFSERLTPKSEKISPVLIHATDDSNTELHLPSSTNMNKDFPTSGKQRISRDLNIADKFFEPTCFADNGDNAGDLSLEKVVSGHHPGGKCANLDGSTNDPVSCLRGHIDLNLSLVEDEAPSSSCLPPAVVKLGEAEIDLEVPVVPECEVEKQIEVTSDGRKEACGELVRVAAEAIVAISVSGGEDFVCDAAGEYVQDTPNECLKWFVDVVSSYECHIQNNKSGVNLKENDSFVEELVPDGMDYFEYMTLKLEDTKSDNGYHNYSAPVMDNEEDEETKVNTLSRRPRRGQARRGRQRKDFQRDILPSLISLSKLEMTEDLQTFEELLRASGYTWQSSLSRRSTAKSSRGRKRSVAMPPTQVPQAIRSPLEQNPVCTVGQPEDKTVTGWGKRTRRLPRQRYVTGSATPL